MDVCKQCEAAKTPNRPKEQAVSEFAAAGHFHRRILEKKFNNTGVYRRQHQFLMTLYFHPKLSQRELADCYHLSAATVAVSLKKLERGGYVERLVDAKDNRFHELSLTEKGRAVAEKSQEIFSQVAQGMFEGFSEEELACFQDYIQRIAENTKQMLRETEREEENP